MCVCYRRLLRPVAVSRCVCVFFDSKNDDDFVKHNHKNHHYNRSNDSCDHDSHYYILNVMINVMIKTHTYTHIHTHTHMCVHVCKCVSHVRVCVIKTQRRSARYLGKVR